MWGKFTTWPGDDLCPQNHGHVVTVLERSEIILNSTRGIPADDL